MGGCGNPGTLDWRNVAVAGRIGRTGFGGTGPTGPAGFIGSAGPTGPAGFQGSQGVQGLQGLLGPTGPNGIADLYRDNPGITRQTPNAVGSNSVAIGNGAYASLAGSIAMSGGAFSSLGDAQSTSYFLRNITTDNIPKELYLDGISDRLLIPDSITWSFYAMVVAHGVNQQKSCAWELRGAIRKDSGSASLRLMNVNKTVITKDDGSWNINISIDNFNGVLKFIVNGNMGQTVRWLARLTTVEVGG